MDEPLAAKVKVAHAEIRPLRNLQGVGEGWVETEVDVVEDSWHSKFPEIKNLPLLLPLCYPSSLSLC